MQIVTLRWVFCCAIQAIAIVIKQANMRSTPDKAFLQTGRQLCSAIPLIFPIWVSTQMQAMHIAVCGQTYVQEANVQLVISRQPDLLRPATYLHHIEFHLAGHLPDNVTIITQ